MTANFDQFPERRITESIKWRYYPEDVLPMWVADMDFVSPEPVVAALQNRAAHGVYGYAEKMPALKEAIVGWLADRHGWQVQPDALVLLPGVVTGLNMAAHAFGESGDNVLVQTPVYAPFLEVPGNAGRILREAPLTEDRNCQYSIDFDAFERAIDARTRLFILCNPHNPVGRVYRPEELEQLAEICLRRNVVICSDEIHCDLVFANHRHTPIASLAPEIARRTITLMAPSKTFNIAGLQCAFAVIPDAEIRRQFQRASQGLVCHLNLMGQTAALAAYRYGKPWLEDLLAYLQSNRDYLVETVQNELPGVCVVPPEGTYLAWLDCRDAGLPESPFKFFIKEARVALEEGKKYGTAGEGFARLNFGCPRSLLAEALERMKAALLARR